MDEEQLLEMVRVLAAFAPRESELARRAHRLVDEALGECIWCARGWPLSLSQPDEHVPSTLAGGAVQVCQRGTALAGTFWSS